MKKVLIGLIIGLILSGVAGFLALPGIRQAAYDSGYDAGNKKGIVTGTNAGIVQGIADIKAMQKREQDSIAQVRQKEEDRRRTAARRVKKTPPPVLNWHVIDGKIAEPVVAETAPAKAPVSE